MSCEAYQASQRLAKANYKGRGFAYALPDYLDERGRVKKNTRLFSFKPKQKMPQAISAGIYFSCYSISQIRTPPPFSSRLWRCFEALASFVLCIIVPIGYLPLLSETTNTYIVRIISAMSWQGFYLFFINEFL